jgi:hypothetical protein
VNAIAAILLLVPWLAVAITLLWQRTRASRSSAAAPAEELARAA